MNKKILLLILVIAAFLISGCRLIERPYAVQPYQQRTPEPVLLVDQGNETLKQRFTNPESASNNAESVYTWSQRYENLLKEHKTLQDQKSKAQLASNDAKYKIDALQIELNNTKKELEDANEFMRKMHVELGNWKADVLGFRDEMRTAQAAQLKAISKVLKYLGAEESEEALALESEKSK